MNRKSGSLAIVYCRGLPILSSLLLKKFSSILPHKCRTLNICSRLLHNIIFNLIVLLYLTARIRKICSINYNADVFVSCAASYTIFISIKRSEFKQCLSTHGCCKGQLSMRARGGFQVYTCVYRCTYTHRLQCFGLEKLRQCEHKGNLMGL